MLFRSQVGLVDAGEAAHDDHLGAPEAGFHGGVLARRTLAVVLVAHRGPADAGLVAVFGDVGIGACLSVEGVDRKGVVWVKRLVFGGRLFDSSEH